MIWQTLNRSNLYDRFGLVTRPSKRLTQIDWLCASSVQTPLPLQEYLHFVFNRLCCSLHMSLCMKWGDEKVSEWKKQWLGQNWEHRSNIQYTILTSRKETVKCTHTYTQCSLLFWPSLNPRHSWCHRLKASNVSRFQSALVYIWERTDVLILANAICIYMAIFQQFALSKRSYSTEATILQSDNFMDLTLTKKTNSTYCYC